MMEKRICNYCEREFNRDEMMFTKDCHGIPFHFGVPEMLPQADGKRL